MIDRAENWHIVPTYIANSDMSYKIKMFQKNVELFRILSKYRNLKNIYLQNGERKEREALHLILKLDEK